MLANFMMENKILKSKHKVSTLVTKDYKGFKNIFKLLLCLERLHLLSLSSDEMSKKKSRLQKNIRDLITQMQLEVNIVMHGSFSEFDSK